MASHVPSTYLNVTEISNEREESLNPAETNSDTNSDKNVDTKADRNSGQRTHHVRLFLTRKEANRRTKLLQLAPVAKDGKEYRFRIVSGNEEGLFHLTHRKGISSLKLWNNLRKLTSSFTLLIEGRPLEVEVGGYEGEQEEEDVGEEEAGGKVGSSWRAVASDGGEKKHEKQNGESANVSRNDGGPWTREAKMSAEEASASINQKYQRALDRNVSSDGRRRTSSSPAFESRHSGNNAERVMKERGDFLLRVQLFFH